MNRVATGWVEFCRLCGKKNGVLISIFDSAPEYLAKIEAVVPDIVILRYDSLPKHVCHRCVAKVKEFYEFRATCIQTQEEFKKKLPWMSGSQKIEENSSMSQAQSPVVMFMGGPLAHPFGDPESSCPQSQPDVEVLTLSDDDDSEEVSSSAPMPAGTSESCEFSTLSRISSAHLLGNGAGSSGNSVHTPMMEPVSTSGNKFIEADVPVYPPTHSSRSLQTACVSSASVGHQASAATPQHYQPYSSHTTTSSSLTLPPVSRKTHLQPSNLSISKNNLTDTRISGSPSNDWLPIPCKANSVRNVSHPSNLVGSSRSNANKGERKSVPLQPTPAAALARNSNVPRQIVSSGKCLTQTNDRNPPCVSIRSAPFVEPNIQTARKLFHGPTVTIGKRVTPGESNTLNVTKIPPPRESIVQSAVCVKVPKEKPKPKCKKRRVENSLTEADVPRIREQYPTVNPVKIYDNKIVYTCILCNVCIISEEAISSHRCGPVKTDCVNDKTKIEHNIGELNETDDTNKSKSDSIELIISDDENSDSSQIPKYRCNMCDKLFHNLGRLQKHEATHS